MSGTIFYFEIKTFFFETQPLCTMYFQLNFFQRIIFWCRKSVHFRSQVAVVEIWTISSLRMTVRNSALGRDSISLGLWTIMNRMRRQSKWDSACLGRCSGTNTRPVSWSIGILQNFNFFPVVISRINDYFKKEKLILIHIFYSSAFRSYLTSNYGVKNSEIENLEIRDDNLVRFSIRSPNARQEAKIISKAVSISSF